MRYCHEKINPSITKTLAGCRALSNFVCLTTVTRYVSCVLRLVWHKSYNPSRHSSRWRSVVPFTEEVNSSLAKRPLVFNGRLVNRRLTSLVKEATGACIHFPWHQQPSWWYRLVGTLQWRHNGRNSVSNHQPHDCLLNCLFTRRSRKTSKPRVTGLCAGNSQGTGEFPAQVASNAENVSIWWRHHDMKGMTLCNDEMYLSAMPNVVNKACNYCDSLLTCWFTILHLDVA